MCAIAVSWPLPRLMDFMLAFAMMTLLV